MPPTIRAMTRVLLPIILGILYIAACALFLPQESALLLAGLMLAYVIPPAGKESVIPLGIALGFPWWLIGTSIALLDVLAGLFMALNFELAFNVPLLGGWISRFMDHGQAFLSRRPYLKKFYFSGLVLFVMFPLQGSGGIGGSLAGRLLGMPRGTVLLAITLGAFLGCYLIALGSEFIWELVITRPALGITVAVAVIATILAGYLAYRRRMPRVSDE
ncbi:MAG TPA: small multi-drug export protein [Methanolinea sp.]|nr:MAG: putative small multi-drug export protein [Methanoregulaceae archaeon PtaB.Bin009]OPY42046.1 MAG: putative small multi-drug export protein [Methanoregulaceae archaeon PtaU1.Bin066]HII75902.1 small multi-drug export protein [Methanolinea sp.]HNQ29603.1 small multi-drug export protein [Methanolinea sp.]